MHTTQLALGVIGLAVLAGTCPARADYDYPWCITDSEYGYPGDCSYQTRQQCLLSASGRKGYCGENPRFILRGPPQQPAPRGRRVSPN
ncbi:hypothetical protein ABIB73_002592 [Bradyrhizobium sp. F1.4.3]